ncbi:MAG TPA: molybdopterin cofactor-binding domain-containing protein [Candidatus Angelobacter sp.]|nr:molybdopterin cofactor-binding domain-containing protein [Candidatus Angelobacter sp.]
MSFSRRDFLKTSGALIVNFAASSLARPFPFAQGPFDTHPSHIDPKKLDSWIAVSADGSITAYTGKCDFGQGMFTVQTQLVAEELCVPLERVKLIQCDTSLAPDQGTTSGSQSTPTNFNSDNLAQAAATAREALIAMAATELGEPSTDLTVAEGVIAGKNGRRVTYAELIGSKRFNIPLSSTAKRRSPSQWAILGKPVHALETAALMTGQFEFVHNVRLPGMLHGRVVRPPEVGATVVSVDEKSIRQIPGVVKVVVRNNFIGVVAEKQSQAAQAARELKVQWKPGPGLPQQKTFFASLLGQPAQDALLVDSRDIEQQLAVAPTVVRATYVYPYQMHGSIGASCAVAEVKPDHVTVWSATQSVYPTRSVVAKLLERPLESVRVVYTRGAGCYGLNGADTVSMDAALLAQAAGKPVRVQLSRQDEMAWENFGAACVIDQRAGIGDNHAILAWDCETWSTSKGGRPGYERPGNVISGMLAGNPSEEVKPRAAAEPRAELRNRSNLAPSYIAGCVNGKCSGAGTVRSERVLSHTVASPFFTGPLRSPLRIQNTFAHECFMDELSARVKADPVAFRLQHLRDQRVIDVVKAAARAAQWEPRPSPQANLRRSGTATGRGIACVAYEGSNGYTAVVAEVSVDIESGRVTPTHFTAAIDCGPISNPDGLRNQTEGGILQGMSRALVEEVTWDEKRVTSTDWESYHSLYLDLPLPSITITLIDRPDAAATGAGETAITVIPAAIGNAIFDATGIRLREIPFTADRVRAALRDLGNHSGDAMLRAQERVNETV